MALIQCPECHHENVSDSAPTCPYCGFEIKKYFQEQINNQENFGTEEQETYSESAQNTYTSINPLKYITIIFTAIMVCCFIYNILKSPNSILGLFVFALIVYAFLGIFNAVIKSNREFNSQNENDAEYDTFDESESYTTTTSQESFTPHCPTCGSTDIEKISVASKVGKTAAFGVFSIGSNSKTFRCKNCGYKW